MKLQSLQVNVALFVSVCYLADYPRLKEGDYFRITWSKEVELQIGLRLKREFILYKKGRGGGYHQYPPPRFRLGDFESQQQHSIDTTDFGFDQGNSPTGERLSLDTARALSTVQPLPAMGAWVCFGLFRWILGTSLVTAIPLSCLPAHPSA